MSNTSATGGGLNPTDVTVYHDTDYSVSDYTPTPGVNPLAVSGKALNAILHDWLMGFANVSAKMIMPRWQVVPANLPDSTTTDWMTFGVTRKSRYGTAYVKHNTGDIQSGFPNGYDTSTRWEKFFVLCSIYGPNQEFTETAISQGIYIPQNNEKLLQYNIRPITTNEPVMVPELIKSLWVQRWDLEIEMTRSTSFNYPIENLLLAASAVTTEVNTTTNVPEQTELECCDEFIQTGDGNILA